MMMPKFPRLHHAAVLTGVASMVLAAGMPASAVAAPYPSDVPAGSVTPWVRIERSSQQLTVRATKDSPDTSRDNYGVTTPPPKPTATPTPTATALPDGVSSATTATGVTVHVTGAGEDGKTYDYDASSPGPIGWPFPEGAPISSSFGVRQVEGCSFCSTFHDGIDFAPDYGTPIHAIAAGKVTVAGKYYGYGQAVVIESTVNDVTFETTYGHIAAGTISVKVGDEVEFGQTFAEVGSTGNSTGPHLHLGIKVNDDWVDPLAWLKKHANRY